MKKKYKKINVIEAWDHENDVYHTFLYDLIRTKVQLYIWSNNFCLFFPTNISSLISAI